MHIVVFGDSIARGAYDHQQGGWVERLKLRGFDQEDCFVYNSSICGGDTDHLVDRMDIECKHRRPDLLIIALGTNDALIQNGKNKMSHTQFEKNLDTIIEIGQSYTNHIIFVGLSKVNESFTVPIPRELSISYTNENIKLYDAMIQKKSSQYNLGYITMADLIENDDLDDGLHLNTQGHQKVFERIMNYIKNNEFIS